MLHDQIKVYVAGKFNDRSMPTNIQIIKDYGFTITHNWTEHLGEDMALASYNDIQGVKDCVILVAIMDDPKYEYRGTFTEIGCALGLGKIIVIVNPNNEAYCMSNCFYYHPDIKHIKHIHEFGNLIKELHIHESIKNIKELCTYNLVSNLINTAFNSLMNKDYIVPIKDEPKIINIIKIPKILIIGKARHGKDTVAELFRKHCGFTYKSSSEFANELFIFYTLKDKYNYSTLKECYNDRVNHREEWYDLICDYNKDDRARLAKELLKNYNIYVGLRDDREFHCAKHLFDIIIYVDASSRLNNEDVTLKVGKDDVDIVILNNGTLDELENKILKISKLIKL